MAETDKTWSIYSFLRAHPNVKFYTNYIASMFLNNDTLLAYSILKELSIREPSTIKKEFIANNCSFCFYYYNPEVKEIKPIINTKKCWICGNPVNAEEIYCPHCGVYQPKLFEEIYK